MSDGSRSRSGCITCRIRKKKCDESRPACEACVSRQLTCYGYSEPAPAWYLSKANWKEVRESDEAKALSALAATRYKIQRKIGSSTVIESSSSGSASTGQYAQTSTQPPISHPTAGPASYPQQMFAHNSWQLESGKVWWDSRIQSLRSDPENAAHEETRLLILYVDVIHPITHQFVSIASQRQRTWLLNRVIKNQSLYRSALSVSACFEISLTQSPRIDEIGITPYVRGLQSSAVSALQVSIDGYGSMNSLSIEDYINEGIDLLDAVFGLLNLELFSMLQGCWELHFEASRTLLNHVTARRPSSELQLEYNSDCNITIALKTWPLEDERRQTLAFGVLNYIWVDIIATSTFGADTYKPCAFDYIPIIKADLIQTEDIMGCYGPIVMQMVEIVRLERWKYQQCLAGNEEQIQEELQTRADSLATALQLETQLLENIPPPPANPTPDQQVKEDQRLISLIFATAAQILLQVIIQASSPSSNNNDDKDSITDQTFVDLCLSKLEALPTRLTIRSTWAYTIAGSMAVSSTQQARFRWIVGKTMLESQPPGMSWKGLMVMEECWRMRVDEGKKNQNVTWRDAMRSLDARVLLL